MVKSPGRFAVESPRSMPYWSDKVAVVTGGSSGLGLAIARALRKAGAKVALAARDEQRLQAAASQIAASGVACDVTRQDEVERLMQAVIGDHGRLDLLVNCAGKSSRGAIAETTAEQFRELLDLNFLSAVRTTQAALPHLLKSRGHVVQIGSLAAKTAGPHLGAYPASKFPLAAYAQQLRLELGPQGLHVLLVCPGPIRRDDAGRRYTSEAAGLPESAAKPGGGVKLKGIDPDWLAERILAACERRVPELVVPGRARLHFALSQLWPSLGDWIVRRMT
jgi:NAD(P)-dependent dehydrogenase (short-subunit alcohol dehydrogenase family)